MGNFIGGVLCLMFFLGPLALLEPGPFFKIILVAAIVIAAISCLGGASAAAINSLGLKKDTSSEPLVFPSPCAHKRTRTDTEEHYSGSGGKAGEDKPKKTGSSSVTRCLDCGEVLHVSTHSH